MKLQPTTCTRNSYLEYFPELESAHAAITSEVVKKEGMLIRLVYSLFLKKLINI